MLTGQPHIKTEIKCPNCNSGEISKPQISKSAIALSILLLGFPLPFIRKTYHCFECQKDFVLKTKKQTLS